MRRATPNDRCAAVYGRSMTGAFIKPLHVADIMCGDMDEYSAKMIRRLGG